MKSKWKVKLIKWALILFILLFGVLSLKCNLYTSVKRPKDKFKGEISQVKSHMDMDGDGYDDQTDILQGALSYIRTRPRYQSRYYKNGYPDDGCGVCTDLVASALRGAGYDLRKLVGADIAAYPDKYGITAQDINIDYRRVKNLRIYFHSYAISKTTDLDQIEEWQGGDIVIFEDHIGIVSDRRNEKGIPYVIHHNRIFQKAFEQDILELRDDLVAHYRISE